MAKKTLLDNIIESIKDVDGRLIKQSGTTKQMISDLNYKVVAPAKSAADSAQSAADAAVASAQVTSDAVSAIASATAEAKQGANDAMSRAKSAWDVAIGAKSAVTDFDPLLKSAQSDAGKALTQIADTANALSDAKTQFGSDVAAAKELANTAQTTADSAVAVASDASSNATVAIQTASGASLTATNAQGDATIAKQTASEAKVQASNAESDFAQLSIRANKIEANVATNSGAIASVQQTANGLTTTVADIQANGGGVNLLVGTSTASGDVANGNGTFVKGAFNGYDAVKTNGAWSERFIDLKSALGRMNAKAGDWYIISVYVKADKQINDGSLGVYRALGNVDANTNDGFLDGIPMQNKPITTQWQQYSWSFQINDISLQRQVTRVEYSQDTGDNWIYWAGWMLEKGVVTHDWSPAIDDFQNQFTQIKTSIDGVTTTINDPKTGLNATYQTAAGNASTISNVKGDVTQLQTTATGLTSRVGNLESKTNTQQTAIEQNKNAITLKADQTDVDTVKGTVTGLQSSLTVQGNQIQTKVSASDVSGMLKGYATQDYTQSLVTQQANTLSSTITTVKNQVNSLESTIDWTTKTGSLDMDTLTTTQNIYYRDTNLKNADGEAGWAYIQVVSMGERVTQTVWHDRSSIQHTRTGAVSGSSYNWDAWNRTATNAQISNLTQSLDGLRSTVATKADQSTVTELSNLVQTKVSSGDFTSTTTQLKDEINQRVQVGDVISQINQEAGGDTLIQVSNGKKSLILDAGNTIITGKAWIPSAAIANLTADDITTGTLKGVKVDFRNSDGTGMIADGSTLTFDVSNTSAGYLSYNGMPVAEIPDGSGGNELAIRYGLSTAIIPNDNSGAQATFSKAAQKIAYMTGTDQGKRMLSGLEVHSDNHHWLGAVNSDATYNRIEINSNDGVNLTWHDNTHFWISDGNAKLYKDNDDGQTATKLEVHGWAWVNGWVEAAGHSQHSTLSSKTRIEEADPDHMLDLVNNTDLTTFAFKSEVAEGVEVRHIGPIIDDVNDVAQYRTPAEFIAPTKTARDDDNMLGALFGAVQALTKRIKKLEDKLNG